jgi:thioredoxin-like negative regulator of GroEL
VAGGSRFKLNRDDGYGVRDRLIDCAAEYLPKENIRAVISRIQNAADKEKDKYGKRHWLHLIETLARQIGDAQLFAEARLASWGKLSTSACMDIAQVYLESGDVQAALSWVKKIPQDETYEADKRDRLLFAYMIDSGKRRNERRLPGGSSDGAGARIPLRNCWP